MSPLSRGSIARLVGAYYLGGVTDSELIQAAIKASGLSARKFAEMVLLRDERTIRRWVAGKSPIPRVVREMLLASLAKRPAPAPGEEGTP